MGLQRKMVLGFQPRRSSHRERGPRGSEVNKRGPCSSEGVNRRGPCGFGVLLSAMLLRQQERLCQEEKGRKDSCWWAMRRCHMVLDQLEIAAATQLMVPGA